MGDCGSKNQGQQNKNQQQNQPMLQNQQQQQMFDEYNQKHQEQFNILSIYGGGIRGIIPAKILVEIEKRLSGACGSKVYIADLFDLCSGTSTGGILSLGATVPGTNGRPKFTAEELLQIYTTNGNRVFQRQSDYQGAGQNNQQQPQKQKMPNFMQGFGDLGAKIQGGLNQIKDASELKYCAEGLEGLLVEYFGQTQFKNGLKQLLITSYSVNQKKPVYFTTKDHPNVLLRDVARATSAAPTFFPCKQIGNDQYIDGGVAVNNPSMRALSYSYKDLGVDIKHCVLLSLGTGQCPPEIPVTKGKLFWADKIFEVASQGDEVAAHEDTERFMQTGNYFHINPVLDVPVELDGVDHKNVSTLVEIGNRTIEKYSDYIDKICHKITMGTYR